MDDKRVREFAEKIACLAGTASSVLADVVQNDASGHSNAAQCVVNQIGYLADTISAELGDTVDLQYWITQERRPFVRADLAS